VMSTYHPKAPWSVGLAMDRNKIIYGLAVEIYAAESNESGGTWEGVLNGLKRGRQVYVRMPEAKEKNANLLLIQKGAVPVDFTGNITTAKAPYQEPITDTNHKVIREPGIYEEDQKEADAKTSYSDTEIIAEAIELLKGNNGKG